MLDKLGKLLKYEFRYYFRFLPPLYLILLLLAAPAGFQMRNSGVLFYLLTTVWGIIIGAMVVMNLVLIIQRFTNNFLKNSGSLMFTLPVTTWALTASKAIAALCMVLMSIIVIAVSGIIYSMGMGVLSFSDIIISASPGEITGLILITIVMILQQICLIYAILTACNILPKFRLAAGVVAYLLIMNFAEWPVFKQLYHLFPEIAGGDVIIYPDFTAVMIAYGIAGLVFAALFFWVTGFLLKRTLNLD
jgi:hypothetical protein